MKAEGQKIPGKGDKKGRVIESDTKNKRSSAQNFPKGGNTISTKETPGIPRGKKMIEDFLEKKGG